MAKALGKIIRLLKENRLLKWVLATRRRKVAFLVVIALFAFLRVNSARKPDWELEVVEIKDEQFIESVSASGEIKAEKFTELTFLSSENIKEILVSDGTKVKKGDLIAKLDSLSLYQSYLQAEADLRNKQATVDRVYDDLKDKDSTETFTERETRTSAEVAKDKAFRAFVIAQKNLTNASLRAPFDGIVNYNEGASIGTYSSPLSSKFSLVDPKTVYFEAEVNEIDIIKITPETKVKIELDAYPGDTFEQQIKSISFVSTITSTGGTAYKVKTSLPENFDNKFRLGMNGDVSFIVSSKQGVLVVPITAIVDEDEKSYAWVINSNKKAKKVEVVTGASSVDDIEITSGLESGDLVIVRPPSKIKEGDRVKSS